MSGLLDKATGLKDSPKEESGDSKVDSNLESKFIEENSSNDIQEDTVYEGILGENSSGFDTSNLKLQLSAIGAFLVTMILVFFIDNTVLFASISLDDFLVPGVIASWVIFNWKDLSVKVFDAKQLAVTGVAFMLVTVVFGGVAMFASGGSGVSIASIDYLSDSEGDMIDIDFYGPKGMDYTVEVLVDGKVKYTHEDTIKIDKGSHSILLDEFWNGNGKDMDDKTVVEYEIRVTSSDNVDSMTFSDIMTREVDTAYVKALEKYNYDDDGKKFYEGIYVEMVAGVGSPDAEFAYANGVFSGKVPQTIKSDWEATILVLGGVSPPYKYEIDDVDEGVAPGYGDFSQYWVSLHLDGGYLEKMDFYDDDGCYTFEITLENEHGETLVSTDSRIKFFWNANDADDDTSNDKPAEAC